MGKERWEHEREGLQRLARVFAEEARGGLLGEALEVLLEVSRLGSGAAFSVEEAAIDLVAEKALGSTSDRPGGGRDPFKEALRGTAKRAATTRKAIFIPAIDRCDLEEADRVALLQRGFRSLAAQPVKHQRDVLGVLIVLTSEATIFDAATKAFFETVAHMVALAAERDRRLERERGYRAELVEAGHMAALGLLTATVSHELRGPVAALGMQLAEQELIISQLREGSSEWARPMLADLAELLAEMTTASTQMGTIISQLSALSRRESSPDKLDLNAVARDALGIARSELRRRNIALVEEYADGAFTMGRRDNLVQVVLNLVFNAADACAVSNRSRPRVTVRTTVEGARVILAVDDTGPGVAPSEVRAIFQPFYTTKRRGQGTGLGLKICTDVVAAHHGHIEVVNLDAGGASFRVILPALSEAAISASPREVITSRPAAAEVEIRKVLVVDDDELFTRTVKRALKPHEVRTAANASEAELALLDPLYSPHVILCDLGLPGMTGDVLHARIMAKRPRLAERFLFVTGGACSKQEADYLRASGCTTLLKPVDMKDIWTAIAASPSQSISSAPEGIATLRSDPPQAVTSDSPTLPPDTQPEPSTETP